MDVTVIVPSFRTLKLTKGCVDSLREYYPKVKLIIVDDCSRDESAEYIREIGSGDNTHAIICERNLGEGVVFDLALHRAETSYAFTLHSDCIIFKGGFLEKMLERFRAEPNLFAIGWLRPMHRGGSPGYVAPSAMMLNRKKYLLLPPFINHGAPAIGTMTGAREAGYLVEDFPISDYIHHERSHGSTGEELKRQIQAGEISAKEIDKYWRVGLRGWRVIKGEIAALREREESESLA